MAKVTGIPRSYCSEFRNGDRQLRPEQLTKLKNYFESKGLVFEDNSQDLTKIESSQPITDLTKPEGIQHTLLAVRHLSIDQSLNTEQINSIFEKIAANDRDAQNLLNEKAKCGLLSDWSEQTDSYLKQVFGLFAANYVLMRHLQGRSFVVLEKPIEDDEIDTVATLFANLFHKENGDLVKEEQKPDTRPSSEDDAL